MSILAIIILLGYVFLIDTIQNSFDTCITNYFDYCIDFMTKVKIRILADSGRIPNPNLWYSIVWNRILHTNLLIFTVIRIPNPESESSQEFRPNPNPESGIRKLTKVRILRFGMRILRFVKLCLLVKKWALE